MKWLSPVVLVLLLLPGWAERPAGSLPLGGGNVRLAVAAQAPAAGPAITEKQAEKLVWAYFRRPRLKAWIASVNARGGKFTYYLEDGPTTPFDPVDSRCYYSYFVGVDLGDHVSRMRTLLVHPRTGELKDYDVLEDRVVPLKK